jgi:hypothetical protein
LEDARSKIKEFYDDLRDRINEFEKVAYEDLDGSIFIRN